jgi:catechol 2,3-dioxygenase-like lactoylglutathione lyase family enzyme
MMSAHPKGLRFYPAYSALAVPVLLAALVWALPYGAPAQDAAGSTVRPYLWQTGMSASELGEVNVFRRFSSERAAQMTAFYGEVLALQALPSSSLGGGSMIRYPVGASEVKLFPVAPSPANTAQVTAMAGVRLLTFFYAEPQALSARFVAHGLPAPAFQSRKDGSLAALVQDPDGEWVELVAMADPAGRNLNRFEIGLSASNLARSRAFYRDFMGLAESGPVRDERLGVDKYSYRHGATTINVWSVDPALPSDTQTAGMQYIVWNVEGVNTLAQARGVTIDRPLSEPGGMMRTVWLTDPDGVSNYFAEYSGNDNRPPPQ